MLPYLDAYCYAQHPPFVLFRNFRITRIVLNGEGKHKQKEGGGVCGSKRWVSLFQGRPSVVDYFSYCWILREVTIKENGIFYGGTMMISQWEGWVVPVFYRFNIWQIIIKEKGKRLHRLRWATRLWTNCYYLHFHSGRRVPAIGGGDYVPTSLIHTIAVL